MDTLYIVIESGCLRYVSTNSLDVIAKVGIKVIYIDENGDSQTDPATIAVADTYLKVW